MTPDLPNLDAIDPKYPRHLLHHLIWDGPFARRIIPQLSSEFFSILNSKVLYGLMRDYFERYHTVAGVDELEAMVRLKLPADSLQHQQLLQFLDISRTRRTEMLRGTVENDGPFVQEQVQRFIQLRRFKAAKEEVDALMTLSGTLNSDDWNSRADEVPRLFREALESGRNESDGINTKGFDPGVLASLELERIPTGIPAFDKLLGGGLPKSKMGLIVAPSGAGKSTTLAMLACAAYEAGKNVVHLVFNENSEKEVVARYYARWSGIPTREMSKRVEYVKDAVEKVTFQHSTNLLHVKQFSSNNTSAQYVYSWLKSFMERHGVKIDLLVLDYIDDMDPPQGKQNQFEGEMVNTKYLHSMLSELDIAMWTATQVVKDGNDTEWLSQKDLAGSFFKIKKAQFVLTFASTLTMRKENLVNIWCIKSNLGPGTGTRFPNCKVSNDFLQLEVGEVEETVASPYLDMAIEAMGGNVEALDEEDRALMGTIPTQTKLPPINNQVDSDTGEVMPLILNRGGLSNIQSTFEDDKPTSPVSTEIASTLDAIAEMDFEDDFLKE
jgi:KaiC/GvpD/RAD55 family RecA-like ATPase